MRAIAFALLLSSCASAPTNICQGAAGYGAAQVMGYPAFLLVLGFTNNACREVMK